MLLDFASMDETVLEKFNGGEKELRAGMYNDGVNKILRGRLVPGASIGLHTHKTSSEIIYFLAGEGKAVCDGETERVAPGICHYCPKGHSHTLINDGKEDLVFFAVVPEQ